MRQPASHLRRGILAALVTAPFAAFGAAGASSGAPIGAAPGRPLKKLYRRGIRVRMAELRPGDVFVSVEPGCLPQAFIARGYPDVLADPCAITCEVLR